METIVKKFDLSNFANVITEKKAVSRGEKKSIYCFELSEEKFESNAELLKEFKISINKKQDSSQIREKIRNFMQSYFWNHSFGESEKDNQIIGLFEVVYKELYSLNDLSVESIANASNKFVQNGKIEAFLNRVKESKIEVKKEIKNVTKK